LLGQLIGNILIAVFIIPTLWPTLEITDVSICNPREHQWQSGDKFAHFGRLHLQP